MGMGLVYGFAALVLVFCIFYMAYSRYRFNKAKKMKKLPRNANIVWNFNAKKTNNFADGFEYPDLKIGKGERELATFQPTDVEPNTDGELVMPPLQKIVLNRGFRWVIPKGKLSGMHNICIYLPNSASEMEFLPEGFLKQYLQKAITFQDAVNKMTEIIEEGKNIQSQIARDMSMGEMRAAEFKKFQEWAKQYGVAALAFTGTSGIRPPQNQGEKPIGGTP
jgi:hypothetical protein